MRNITEAEFDAAVAHGRALVDFWATWCGPCQMQGLLLEQKFAPAHPEIEILKVNVDEQPALAARFGVQSIPTLLLYRDGKQIANFVGLTKPDELAAAFAS